MPGRGSIPKFFNNIDVDSELKNINEIDTKCSERLFKIDPRDSKTKLSCYSDTLVKDYKKCEDSHGSTWCDYQKCGKLETFEKCDSKDFNVLNQIQIYLFMIICCWRKIKNSEVLSPDLMNQIKAKQERIKYKTLEQQERQRQYQIQFDLELLTQKRDITLQNNLENK